MGKIVSINSSSTRGSSRMAEVRDKFDRFDWMRGWLRDEEIDSGHTKLVLTVLFDHMGQNGKAWPSVATIARLASCGKRTVQKHIRIAQDLGWVQVTERDGNSSIYAATHPRSSRTPATDAPPQQMHPTPAADEGGTPAADAPKQTIEQTIEQTKTTAAGGREGEGGQPEEFAGLKNQSMWARKYDLDELPDSERMDPMEFVALWKQSTGERISIFHTKGVGRSARHVLRFFSKDTLVDLIELAADPSTKDPWSYLVGCLKREASGEGAPDHADERGSSTRKEGSIDRGFFDDIPEEYQRSNVDLNIFD